MKIVLIGAPASGKGTQARLLSEKYGLVHISTGDIFREILKGDSPLKDEVERYMNNGLLVPDELTIKLVLNRLASDDVKNGYLLDGFPRTVNQAKLFKEQTDIDYAVYIDTPYETLVNRTVNRIGCPNCKKIFNKTSYNSDECDNCGEKLVSRADDNEETVAKRYNEFKTKSYPLVEYYKNQGKLISVNGDDLPENIFEILKSKIK